jgi:hypothetical protein
MATQKKRTAVITDSVSSEFYFPCWHKYYAAQFGIENLYVVTYDGMRADFKNFDLGGVWETKVYNNDLRIRIISGLINVLLEHYEYVIRVDTDEFLAADPRVFLSLADYMARLERPYVTAMGYDVVPGSDDNDLVLDQHILLTQRRRAYPYDALNKTCITSIPLTWAPGFHFCSAFPMFHQLYLFHLKRADVSIQMRIGEAIAKHAPGERNRDYYLTNREAILGYNRSVLTFPSGSGWDWFDRTDYNATFLKSIYFTKTYGGVYHGPAFRLDKALVEIPAEFLGTI